jgi:hypothetical protein
MPTERSSAGDPARTLKLLWGDPADQADTRRGPRQSLSIEQVVAAAINLADTDGLGALTMRQVAHIREWCRCRCAPTCRVRRSCST